MNKWMIWGVLPLFLETPILLLLFRESFFQDELGHSQVVLFLMTPLLLIEKSEGSLNEDSP